MTTSHSKTGTTPQASYCTTTSEVVTFTSNTKAALHWLNFGFKVIPLVEGSKMPAVAWDGWFRVLSPETVASYWQKHPNADLAFLVGQDLLVLDADTPEAEAALSRIEREHSCPPVMRVRTARGWHHYFRLQAGTYARTDTHSTTEHPERIDVKTGRTLVTLPPSTGKELDVGVAKLSELSIASQPFIDAIFVHNGRKPPRLKVAVESIEDVDRSDSAISEKQIAMLLEHVSPDVGYNDWCNVQMAVHCATNGSDVGFDLIDSWSSKGSSYAGRATLREKWHSFEGYTGKPITIGTLIWMASENGADTESILSGDERFVVCETEIGQSVPADAIVPCRPNPLAKFSLLGKSEELERNSVEEVFILGEIALKGQATAIYAAPNTGKTLLTFRLLTQAIVAGRINPASLYYLNMDDTASGLREKVRLSEEFGFHVLAESHADFQIGAFVGMVNEMIQNDQCRDVIIVLDTLKKFTNLMDKSISSGFAKVIRRFVLKGGTLIALAHTNKNPGRNGKPTYSGTSDIIDDFDCAYLLAMVSIDQDLKLVEFENIKRRGNVAPTAAYSYAIERDISYPELLLSVKEVEPSQLLPLKMAEAIWSDGDVIKTVSDCINDGINTKMRLAEATAERSGVSKRTALKAIENYTGNDPTLHRWSYEVRDRGAKVYALLPSPPNP